MCSTSFRKRRDGGGGRGVILPLPPPPLQNEPLKSPHRLGLRLGSRHPDCKGIFCFPEPYFSTNVNYWLITSKMYWINFDAFLQCNCIINSLHNLPHNQELFIQNSIRCKWRSPGQQFQLWKKPLNILKIKKSKKAAEK